MWRRVDDDSFTGVYEDSNGTKVIYSLVLKEGKRFEVESTALNGAKMASEGTLDADGVIRSLDKMTAPDGQLVVTITSETRRKQEVEQGGADQPATAPELKPESNSKPQQETEVRPQ